MKLNMIPQEIIDVIIDFVQDDTDALKNCALVSNTWTRACHRHLFHTLTVGGFPWAVQFRRKEFLQLFKDRKPRILQQLKAFHYFLETSPHIASHCIQVLNLRIDRDPMEPQPRRIHRIISTILPKFTAVWALDLNLGVWADYTADFQQSIHTLIQHPSLSSVSISAVTFESITDLSSLVACSPGLSNLAIRRTTVRRLPSAQSHALNANFSTIYLHDLRLENIHMSSKLLPSLLHPASLIKLVRLRRLHLGLSQLCGSQRQVIDELLDQCHASLQHLWIVRNSESSDIPSVPLHLHSFSDLLSFRFASQRLSSMHDNLRWVVTLFSHIVDHSDSPLQEVEISMISHSRLLWGGAQTTAWQELDYALTRVALHHLRRVKLTIEVHEGPRDFMRNWEARLIDILPLLKAHPRNILEVKFTTDRRYPAAPSTPAN